MPNPKMPGLTLKKIGVVKSTDAGVQGKRPRSPPRPSQLKWWSLLIVRWVILNGSSFGPLIKWSGVAGYMALVVQGIREEQSLSRSRRQPPPNLLIVMRTILKESALGPCLKKIGVVCIISPRALIQVTLSLLIAALGSRIGRQVGLNAKACGVVNLIPVVVQ